ncbi:MAG: hypothetical protein MUE41_17550, partial [Gemmatimonadaceae bacterium]|nr:hypothetical protein [Gemmatimonadaceae bacterium]
MSRPLILSLALCAAAAPLAAQPVRPLPKPDAEFAEPFSQLIGLRELRDGRVVAADLRDKTVQVIDFTANAARAVGREGSGPNEFGLPMRVVALAADTTAIFDPMNGRFFVVRPDGSPGGTFSAAGGDVTTRSPNGGAVRVGGMSPPQGTDARGRMYFKGAPFVVGPDGPTQADSSPIFRVDRATGKTDTLGYAWNGEQASVSGNAREMRVMIGIKPYAASDEWTVLPDGRVAIVRARQKRVDVLGGAAPVRGPEFSVAPIAVGEAEKEEYREQRRRATPIMIQRTDGPGGARTQAGTGAARAMVAEPSEWPKTKPAYVAGSIFAAPNNTVWVQRSRKASDKVPVYDVFDATGKMIDRISMPPETRVVG